MNLKLTMGLLAVVAVAGFGTAYAQSSADEYTLEEQLQMCGDRAHSLFETKEYLMAELTSANAELRDLKTNGVGGELDRVKAELEDTKKSLNTTGALYQKYFKQWQDYKTAEYHVKHLTAERDALQERIDNLPEYVEIAGHAIKTIPDNAFVDILHFDDNNALDILITSRENGSTVEIHIPRTVFDARTDGCTGEDADFTHVVKRGTLNEFTVDSNEYGHVFEFDVGRGTNVITVTGTCALGV